MRPTVARNMPTSPKKAASRAQLIVTLMSGNPLLPSPTPPLAEVQADLDLLAEAEAAVLTRAKATREIRDARLGRVRTHIQRLAGYVQEIADQGGEDAHAIIASAGFDVKKPAIPTKAPFEVRPGPVPGSAKLSCRALGDRVAYAWRSSKDGTTWEDEAVTIQSSTVVTGLTPRTPYLFQVRALLKDGYVDWSDPASFLVP